MTPVNQANPDNQEQQEQDSQEHPPRSTAEKVTFGIASALLAIVVGLVCYVWINPDSKNPPDIVIDRPEAIREASAQFYVPFEVKNQGGETAESVQVLAELEINGEVIEEGEQQIDFLSGGETEEGAFVFTQDPRQGELTLRVGSYKLP